MSKMRFNLVRELEPRQLGNVRFIGKIKTYANDIYTVGFACRVFDSTKPFEEGCMIHLSVSRKDNEPIHSWSDLQQIKNELVGKEYTAVEVYPCESMLTDVANCYHLWVYPQKGYALPFGLHDHRVVIGD